GDKQGARLEASKKVLRRNRLAELNVIEQALNVASTSIVRAAWERQQRLTIHGWIYAIENGLLRALGLSITRWPDAAPQCEAAVAALGTVDAQSARSAP